MQAESRRQLAESFKQLHAADRPLVLVNAWDAASARLLESNGASAIATTSAGIAWTLGYSDGERMPFTEMLDVCKRICRVVKVPVSADVERGFAQSATQVSTNVMSMVDTGIVGINIEDGIDGSTGRVHDPAILVERITAIRKASDSIRAPLFINARIDNYFAAMNDPVARYEDTVLRARMYVEAGADGIFAPGLVDLQEIERLASTIGRPLNIYAGYSGVPSVTALAEVGVKRISLGCGPLQAALALTQRIAVEAFEKGTLTAMTGNMLSVREVNGLF
jgi:2-methylisocitrate lyase-like PEP mutase family enzyme